MRSSLSWWASRARQFRAHVRASVGPAERSDLATWLSAPQLDLFDTMHVADRRHGLDVVATLRAEGGTDAEVLLAGLLHDAGKGQTGVWPRVAYTLGQGYGAWVWRVAGAVPGSGFGAALWMRLAYSRRRTRMWCWTSSFSERSWLKVPAIRFTASRSWPLMRRSNQHSERCWVSSAPASSFASTTESTPRSSGSR